MLWLRHVWLNYEQGGPVFLRPKTFQGFATALCTTMVRAAKPPSYAPLTATPLERYLTSHCFYSKTEIFPTPTHGSSPLLVVLDASS